jgi:hypothetical protein
MGLDMNLYKRMYVQNWDHFAPEHRWQITITKGGQPVDPKLIDASRLVYIEQELGYWRKANAIHNWFVVNCADGVDECQTIHVERSQLQTLLDTVTKILDSAKVIPGQVHVGTSYASDGAGGTIITENYEDGYVMSHESVVLAQELLPSKQGFFFGGTDYDEWYLDSLRATRTILEDALSHPEDDIWADFVYRASW